MKPLYREIIIWRREGEAEAVRFTCFEDLATAQFCVQVADFVRIPLDDKELRYQYRNRTELLIEGQLDGCTWRPSLAEAIEAHDRDFEDLVGRTPERRP